MTFSPISNRWATGASGKPHRRGFSALNQDAHAVNARILRLSHFFRTDEISRIVDLPEDYVYNTLARLKGQLGDD